MLVAPSDGGAVGTIYCYIDDVSLAPCEGQGLAPIPDAAHLLMTDPSGAGLLIGASVPPGARLRVLDGRGRLVQEGRALPHHVIDLSARADGFYVVEIIAPGGLIARTKFIKQGR